MKTKSLSYRPWLALALACAAIWFLNTQLAYQPESTVNWACCAMVALWGIGALCVRLSKHWQPRYATWLIFAGGFCVCAIFMLKLPYLFSYHDLADYPAELSQQQYLNGHLGYIAYIVNTGSLPFGVNPMVEEFSIAYNPPLYHIVQACFVRLNLLLGIPREVFVENMQVVTLFIAGGCMLVTIAILRQLALNERGMRAGALLFCFQPMLFLFGSTLNNDLLSVLFVLLCILFALRWLELRRMRDIVGVALSLGAGMATKLSSAMLAPALAIVFAVCFFQSLPEWKKYVKQYAVFLLVSVPIGTAWSIYQAVAHQMPLNYVRLPSEVINVSRYPLTQRLGPPDWYAVRSLFCTGIRKTEHNVWMQTLKTGVFDELILFEDGTAMWYVSYVLLVMFAVLLLISLALFIRMLVKRQKGLPWMGKLLLTGYGATLIASYIQFCIQYPYISSSSFRYILPVLALCAVAMGCYRSETSNRRSLWAEAYTGLFAIVCLVVYSVYFFA